MERLTEKTETGAALKLNAPRTEQEARDQLMAAYEVAINRLAAYEDTGITPEQITANKSIIGDLTREICRQESEIEKLRELLKLAVEDMATAASDFCEYCSVCKYCKKDNYTCEYRMNIKDCINASDFRWQHADEVEEVLKDD